MEKKLNERIHCIVDNNSVITLKRDGNILQCRKMMPIPQQEQITGKINITMFPCCSLCSQFYYEVEIHEDILTANIKLCSNIVYNRCEIL